MKVGKYVWVVLALFVGKEASSQILKNNIRPDVIVIDRRSNVDSLFASEVISKYYATLEKGFRQVGLPRFIIAGREQKMIFGLGGNVNMRLSYDFDGMARSLDFVTSTIPVPNTPVAARQTQFDATTSTLFFKAIARAGRLGNIVGYIQSNFRGPDNSFSLQMAYIELAGFSVGRRFTTFCDLEASPSTVDYEGPNSYQTFCNTMIRYTHKFNEHWSMAVAAEMPEVSASWTSETESLPQRVPDFPIYFQYSWNGGRSHLRASAVFRDMYYYNRQSQQTHSVFGWGTQMSGSFRIGKLLTLYMQMLYGEGIASYIQDIADTGLDLVPNPREANRLQTLPMMGWIGGLQWQFSPKFVSTFVYSGVKLFGKNDYKVADTYDLSHYLSANLFFNLTGSCQIGVAYLYGTRRNMNHEQGHANRVQAIVQYNF